MFKRILVPLDGSQAAEEALLHAVTMAQGGNLRLIRVQFSPGAAGFSVDLPATQGIVETEGELCDAYLAAVAKRLDGEGATLTWTRRVGNVAPAILEEAEEWKADLLVLTTHGRTGISRFLLGSVAEKLARHATCPVLLLRARASETAD